ncbi:endolytic transglycosylase MltG [Candidatus Parcubacteria bacterium]|nr:endolytic transglycosylase MltG [Candidatus Parcubacteria bacterium]
MRIAIFICTILLIISTLFVVVVVQQIGPPICFFWCRSQAQVETESFIVNPKETLDEIIQRLNTEGFIKTELAFKSLRLIERDQVPIKPGEYKISKSMSLSRVYSTLTQPPEKVWLDVPEFREIDKLGKFFAQELGWNATTTDDFIFQFRRDTHAHVKKEAMQILSLQTNWDDLEKKTAEELYDNIEYDILTRTFVPGSYLIPLTDNGTKIALYFFEKAGAPVTKRLSVSFMHKSSITRLFNSVRNAIELLPDIVPQPPYDIQITSKDSQVYLVFSSAYWNQGTGPLVLVPGSRDQDLVGDIATNIYQRIYRTDGAYRTRLAGTFLWHDEHDHYHFDDFMDYILAPVDAATKIEPVQEKTSFCVRDKDLIKKLPGSPTEAKYSTCSTTIQGVSVGWGDVYKYTLADQDINITKLPKGYYRLIFEVNPGEHFNEVRMDNNSSSVLLLLDPQKHTVQIQKE